MKTSASDTLKRMASKYVWWKTPAESLAMPDRVIAQVMNIGEYSDVQQMANELGDEALRDVLERAEPGQFNSRSWTYWHYRLGLAQVGQVPPLPIRKFRSL